MKFGRSLVALSAATVFALSACSPGGEAAGSNSVRLSIGSPADPVYASVLMADQKGLFEEAGVEVLDLVPVFHGEPNPARFYAADGHFSAEGSRFIAGWLADRLKLTRKRLDRLTGVAGHGDPLDRP